MVFPKTERARRSLAQQFSQNRVRKRYLLETDCRPSFQEMECRSRLVRKGDRYRAYPADGRQGTLAVTRFQFLGEEGGRYRLMAEPITGRTHQIRVQAACNHIPVLGDAWYGGRESPSQRLHLHSWRMTFEHPEEGTPMTIEAPPDFSTPPSWWRRAAMIDPDATDAYRLLHGAAEDRPGWYVDHFGAFLLSQSEDRLTSDQQEEMQDLAERVQADGAYHKIRHRQVRQIGGGQLAPEKIFGTAAPEPFTVRENGLRFAIRLGEGYSPGLFLDQRENRRRLRMDFIESTEPVARRRLQGAAVLNTFAYTCGFSVCAALAGAQVTSQDLSPRYLEWGKENFRLNGLDPDRHDFIHGDALDWMKRLANKGRQFRLILLDPPTFSQAKRRRTFQVMRDLPKLVERAAELLEVEGTLFVSSNAARLTPETFLEKIRQGLHAAGRKVRTEHYFPQPPDFPISRKEPAYLKTVWLHLD